MTAITSRLAAACALLATVLPTGARAQAAPDFYAGKTINIIVGFSPGGIYDATSRMMARHFGRFIPGNPSVVVQNQPGAGGATLANRLSKTIERNGTTVVAMSRGLPQLALVGDPSVQFDPLELTWLGSLSSYKDDAYFMTINARHPAKTLADLRPGGQLLHLGATALGSTNGLFSAFARDQLGLNIKVVGGFPGAREIWAGMDRGEIDGQMVDISAILVGRPDLWRSGQLRPMIGFGRSARHPEHPNVPTGRELVRNADDLALLVFSELPFFMAAPYCAPPGIPQERARLLKDGFMAMAADAAFKADMDKVGIMTSPIDGEAVHKLIADAAKTPQPVRDRYAKLLVSN